MAEQKKRYFLELIEEQDLEAFPDALWFIALLKKIIKLKLLQSFQIKTLKNIIKN